MHKKFILAFIFIMLTSMNAHAATLSASVDKTTIPLGEAFTLVINAGKILRFIPHPFPAKIILSTAKAKLPLLGKSVLWR